MGDTGICGSVCTEYVLAARVERKSWRDGDVPGRLVVTCKCWALDEGHAEIQKYKKEQTYRSCDAPTKELRGVNEGLVHDIVGQSTERGGHCGLRHRSSRATRRAPLPSLNIHSFSFIFSTLPRGYEQHLGPDFS